jgi:hypothetical protein
MFCGRVSFLVLFSILEAVSDLSNEDTPRLKSSCVPQQRQSRFNSLLHKAIYKSGQASQHCSLQQVTHKSLPEHIN